MKTARIACAALVATAALALAPSATAASPTGTSAAVNVWASNVNTHTAPYTDAPVVGQVGPGLVEAVCQAPGGSVSYGDYYNYWWAQLDDGSWISDVFISGGENDAPVPGIPEC